MNLKDLERPRGGGDPYIGRLTDTVGDTHYELAISGPSELIQQVLGKSDFEYRIDPKATDKDLAQEYKAMLERAPGFGSLETSRHTVAALDAATPEPATAENSIVVSVRRTAGHGTSWMFFWPYFTLPKGHNLLFVLPPICFCAGVVVPNDPGNPDLFLNVNSPTGPLMGSSTLGPGFADRVASPRQQQWCWPWEEFVPWYRVNAATTCLATFLMAGFGVLP